MAVTIFLQQEYVALKLHINRIAMLLNPEGFNSRGIWIACVGVLTETYCTFYQPLSLW